VYNDNVKTRAMFDAYGLKYTFQQFDGAGHTWETWRHNLLDFAPRVFGRAGVGA
jgi:enterochelin esterase family protein